MAIGFYATAKAKLGAKKPFTLANKFLAFIQVAGFYPAKLDFWKFRQLPLAVLT